MRLLLALNKRRICLSRFTALLGVVPFWCTCASRVTNWSGPGGVQAIEYMIKVRPLFQRETYAVVLPMSIMHHESCMIGLNTLNAAGCARILLLTFKLHCMATAAYCQMVEWSHCDCVQDVFMATNPVVDFVSQVEDIAAFCKVRNDKPAYCPLSLLDTSLHILLATAKAT